MISPRTRVGLFRIGAKGRKRLAGPPLERASQGRPIPETQVERYLFHAVLDVREHYEGETATVSQLRASEEQAPDSLGERVSNLSAEHGPAKQPPPDSHVQATLSIPENAA